MSEAATSPLSTSSPSSSSPSAAATSTTSDTARDGSEGGSGDSRSVTVSGSNLTTTTIPSHPTNDSTAATSCNGGGTQQQDESLNAGKRAENTEIELNQHHQNPSSFPGKSVGHGAYVCSSSSQQHQQHGSLSSPGNFTSSELRAIYQQLQEMAASCGAPSGGELPEAMSVRRQQREVEQKQEELEKHLVASMCKKSYHGLAAANDMLFKCPKARLFLEDSMILIITFFLAQDPSKIEATERSIFIESVDMVLEIIAKDLEYQTAHGNCSHDLLLALPRIFNVGESFFSQHDQTFGSHSLLARVAKFQHFRGFQALNRNLHTWMKNSTEVSEHTRMDWVNVLLHTLTALDHAVRLPDEITNGENVDKNELITEVLYLGNTIILFIERDLFSGDTQRLLSLLVPLRGLIDHLPYGQENANASFYASWRTLTLRLLQSRSPSMTTLAWDELNQMIEACGAYRPPPRTYQVIGAGSELLNGLYNLVDEDLDKEYFRHGYVPRYQKHIFEGSHTAEMLITLCRCVVRDKSFRWFICEMDEDQPGTDRDVDYYSTNSRENLQLPPHSGWKSVGIGADPAPHLVPIGSSVPKGREFATPEHDFAIWIVENNLVGPIAFDGDSVHKPLLQFMTDMVKRHFEGGKYSQQSLKEFIVADEFFNDPKNLLWQGNEEVFRDRLLQCKKSDPRVESLLEVAIQKKASFSFISVIVELAPTLIDHLSLTYDLYPFQLAAAKDHDLDTVFLLLRNRPDVVRISLTGNLLQRPHKRRRVPSTV